MATITILRPRKSFLETICPFVGSRHFRSAIAPWLKNEAYRPSKAARQGAADAELLYYAYCRAPHLREMLEQRAQNLGPTWGPIYFTSAMASIQEFEDTDPR